ncbi:hypothetical protein BDZ90DRAFT_259970 [Jaminaea rosea]|uniref:Homing endonuclease LAGLIDADG domain-containing protein n=1 Tax=Jaminaea rosea TaxID=1569628 RepID=A0A316US81_9BASI|nr:hypothetical protein BDZ90DRAFT_259970 [Jaminaea rosea]PWN28146.1 hypothetical protein BDZ90DRAFT_259970 [Jaminaea rosea]
MDSRTSYIFKAASEDVRAAVLAGFIDSDGTVKGNGYFISQSSAHAKAIADAREMAMSIGIRAGEVRAFDGQKPDGAPTPLLGLYLSGQAIGKLQPYLLLDYKRLDPTTLRKMDLDGKLVIARPHQPAAPAMGRSLHFAGRELSLVQLQEGYVVSGGVGPLPASASS